METRLVLIGLAPLNTSRGLSIFIFFSFFLSVFSDVDYGRDEGAVTQPVIV